MPQREPPANRFRHTKWLSRLDCVAADLNAVLVIFAIGPATLDLTFLVSRHVIDRLPQVTRVTYFDRVGGGSLAGSPVHPSVMPPRHPPQCRRSADDMSGVHSHLPRR